MKSFCTTKENISKVKRQPSEWEKIIANEATGKTTRPFRYDLSQIPYDYTVKVTNRFKGLDLIDRLPGEL